ncbi:TIGR04086 family membrane protein [Paenibacillaceae bacterium]|nr:TIGR04086 family membrane protein [Paenibacillaceae bacterium]
MKNATKVRTTSPLLSGLLYAFAGLGLSIVVLSLALHLSGFSEAKLPLYALIAHGLSTFVGGFVAGKRSGYKGWYYGAALGTIYGLVILLISFLAVDSSLTMRSLLIIALTMLAGSIGGMIGVNASNNNSNS